jgi:membrane protein implicated in regulation of membrane protease activity
MHIHLNKRHIWQAAFILIILYAVSSINVLVLIWGVLLPYLIEAFHGMGILFYFARVSFVLAAFLSIYHVYLMFNTKKRKTDTEDVVIGFKGIWRRSRPITKLLFLLVCLYIIAAVYMLLWILGIAGNAMGEYEVIWIVFSLVSFGVSVLIAAYHLASWILRQKRASDHIVVTDALKAQ